jgi:hypothetical protein
MARGVNRSDVGSGRVGGAVLSFNRYSYPKREPEPVVTLEELRAEHQRLVLPLLQAAVLTTGPAD